jgi:hypothetical protein
MKFDQQLNAAIGGYTSFLFDRVLNPLIVIFVVFAFLIFFWFITKQLWGEMKMEWTEKSTGVFWGVIGLTIVLTAIALTWLMGNTGNELFQSNKATDGLNQINYIKVNGK